MVPPALFERTTFGVLEVCLEGNELKGVNSANGGTIRLHYVPATQ